MEIRNSNNFSARNAVSYKSFMFHLTNTFFAGDFDGSENDFDGNDVNCDDSTDPKNYGRRHWERSEKPIMKFKEEKVL